jgi:hypothetical protein
MMLYIGTIISYLVIYDVSCVNFGYRDKKQCVGSTLNKLHRILACTTHINNTYLKGVSAK